MEWIASWFDGISDTWIRIFTVAGFVLGAIGSVLGAIGLGLAAYQIVTGRRLEQFLYDALRKRTEIGGLKNFGAMEGAAQVGVKKKAIMRHPPLPFRLWRYLKDKLMALGKLVYKAL